MLFVFGKKAKQIRLDKIANLIHKSDNFPNLREGRVTVYFQEIIDYTDHPEEFIPIAGTELNIARSATSSGGSTYYINGSKSSHAEVTTLLKAKGIDLDHNRFLILQGEVEQISLMKPKALTENEEGLLEYIEDIIGTQEYRPKIEAGLADVDKLTEEREIHVKRVQQAENDREALDGAKLEAEEFLRLEVKLCKQRGLFIQMKHEALSEELQQKESHLAELKEQFDEKRKQGAELKKDLQKAEEELRAEKKKADQLMKGFDTAQEKFRKLDANAAKQHANKEHARKQYEKARAAHKKAVNEVTKTEDQIAASTKELEESQAELEELEGQLETDKVRYETQTEALQEKLRPLRARYEDLKKEIAPHAEKVSECEKGLRLLNTEKDFTKGDDQARDLKSRLEHEHRNLAEVDSRVGQLKEQLAINKQELQARSESHAKEQARYTKASDALPKLRALEQEKLGEVETLKKQLQELGSEGAVTKALKRLKQQGGLDGYYGRLGDLGTIDDKYSAAVSSASGGHLNTLVVDCEETGQKILKYLKETNTGRASILLLDHQQRAFGERIKAEFRGPGGLPRLFDLIEPCHPRFAAAFYSGVRDTLVADDMEVATRIAFADKRSRPRVVTLKGELIEQTGTMTGGGRTNSHSGGMRSYQVSQEDQEVLRAKLGQAQGQLEQVNTDARQLNAQIHDSKNKLLSLNASVKEMQSLIRSRTGELAASEDRVKQVRATVEQVQTEQSLMEEKMKADAAKIKQIEERVETAQAQLEEARAGKKDMDQQLEVLEAQMDKIGGTSYTKLKHTIKANSDRVAELEKKVSTSGAAVNAGNKHLAGRRQAIEKTEKEQDRTKAHLDSLGEVDEEDDEQLKSAKAKVKEIKKEIDEQKKATEKVEKQRDKCKASLNDRKADEAKAQHDLKAQKGDTEQARAKVHTLEGTLSNIDEALRKSIDKYGTTILDPEEIEDPTTFDFTTYSVAVSKEELGQYDQTAVKRAIQRLEETQKKLSPNVKALEEWREKNKVLLKRSEDLKEVSERRTEAQTAVETLKKTRHDEFMTGFQAITYKLKEMYQMLTMGGDAELELVDTFDPFTEGLLFSVRPPKKSWKHISNLSGGEKTLSSLALVFALHHFKPTPLYVMDEIDAALDFKNVSIVANYVTSAASNAQFIIISLRSNMFELANRLVGICKTENCTQSAAINPANYTSLLPPVPVAEQINNGMAPLLQQQAALQRSQTAPRVVEKRVLEEPTTPQQQKMRRVDTP
eukprot:TRINITY_DN27366_c0_g1_i1.p1 TRINITY_DN27366_c0_g1~~TRINITY_DN27366_c0_g1_i1.p1  ORF type:complete len:1382 (+),score=663.28 TRINITY_DN27366_c0_g1_i1:390-4148(+)